MLYADEADLQEVTGKRNLQADKRLRDFAERTAMFSVVLIGVLRGSSGPELYYSGMHTRAAVTVYCPALSCTTQAYYIPQPPTGMAASAAPLKDLVSSIAKLGNESAGLAGVSIDGAYERLIC